MKTDNQEAGALFGEQLPAGQYQLALYAQVATFIVPGQCNLFCAKNIPTAENNNTGQNWTRTNIPDAEAPLLAGDREVDDSALSTAGKEADKAAGRGEHVAAHRPAAEHLHLEDDGRRSGQ